MKKFLIAVLVISALLFLRNYWDGIQTEKASHEFANDTVEDLTEAWQLTEFQKVADPYMNMFLVNGVQIRSLADSLPLYARLGKRTSDADCEMANFTRYSGDKENYIAANYTCTATFEHAHASIIISVRRFKTDGPWKMSYLDVSSPYLVAEKSVTAQKAEADKEKAAKKETLWKKLRNKLPSIPSFTR